jgi:uracil-DNA glycosylase family 4
MSLSTIRRQVISCQRCPRLRAYCARIAKDKRAAYRDEEYWGRPVPSFGDRRARVLVLGLAPGAHGANRTGRMFTGDRSGDFLMEAMHAAGFATLPTSHHAKDRLTLRDAYISAVVRCAPPENKPTTTEISRCSSYLSAELDALAQLRVVVALGKIAFDAYWRVVAGPDVTPRPRPRFTHGFVFEADTVPALVAAYHPSQQNTNTGKLTPQMMADVLSTARTLAGRSSR